VSPDLTFRELQDQLWFGPVIAVGIFLISLLLAFIAHKILFPLALRLAHRTPTDLDSRIINATRWPLNLGIVVLGAYLAVTVPLGLGSGVQAVAGKWFGTAGLALGVLAMVFAVTQALNWYLEGMASQTRQVIDPSLVPLFRRIGVLLVYGLGGLLILDLLSINISPLIAGLGLGGLAVALAIQPTLSNLFAGTYVMTEGVVSPGDYIQLEGSVSGYVLEVSWRSTRIRTWTNNLVVIPNSKFADTIITNYNMPQQAVNVFLTCGVSYESDLVEVERVCQDVMDQVLAEGPDGVKEYGGWFGFDGFGESNVNFWLFVQAKDRLASFTLQSTLVRRLTQRLRDEGIVINYPVRAVRFQDERESTPMTTLAGTPARARRNGRSDRRRQGRRRTSRDLIVQSGEGEGPGGGEGGLGPG
jgi:small-conductance mechanosensitive channel